MTVPFPTAKIAQSELLIQRYQQRSTSPYGGYSQTTDYGASIAFSLTFVPQTVDQAGELEAWLETEDDFYFSPPGYTFVTGKGTARINGAGQTGTSINSDGWTPVSSTVMRKGDWLQLGDQLCRLRADLVSTSGSNGVIQLTRPLRVALANNALIDYATPQGLFRIRDAERTVSRVPLFSYVTVTIEEAI